MLFLSLPKLQTSSLPVDGLELRLDCFPRIDKEEIQSFCLSLSLPYIFTLRKVTHGGQFKGSEEERLALIEDLLSLHPPFVDLEWDTDPEFIKKIFLRFPETKILLSYHNFQETPTDLSVLFHQMICPHAYGYKIATWAHSSLDALRIALFVKEFQGKRISGFCMGKEGSFSRLLGPIIGNFIDYGSLEETLQTAPGQIPVEELLSLYHYRSLNSSTRLYGLIGDPVDRSISHLVHNAVMDHFQWDALYVKMRVKKEELTAFFPLVLSLGFSGLSVTMPLKQEILSLLARIDPQALQIGAVNTLSIHEDQIFGMNTDGRGALDALECKGLVKGKKIILLGAGGAARAIAYESLKRGAQLLILNRTEEKALQLAKELGCRGGKMEDLTSEFYHILINATPEPLPINPQWLLPRTIVMDIKTRPKISPFLAAARQKGCVLVYGYEMFLHQALGQLYLWFSHQVPKDFLEQICLKNLGIS